MKDGELRLDEQVLVQMKAGARRLDDPVGTYLKIPVILFNLFVIYTLFF